MEHISKYKYNSVLHSNACSVQNVIKRVAKREKIKVALSICLILAVKAITLYVHGFSQAYFVDFFRKRPPPVSDHFFVHQEWSLPRELSVLEKPKEAILWKGKHIFWIINVLEKAVCRIKIRWFNDRYLVNQPCRSSRWLLISSLSGLGSNNILQLFTEVQVRSWGYFPSGEAARWISATFYWPCGG